MLSPKRTKFKKQHCRPIRGLAHRNNKIAFGEYALQSLESGWITSKQIEATRRTITRSLKRGGKLWIKIFPDKPITARAAESRMGSGKGAVDYWVAIVKPGTILFELGGVSYDFAETAMNLAAYKLPIKTKFIFRNIKEE
jgi:large subunit ribosomal protein L16